MVSSEMPECWYTRTGLLTAGEVPMTRKNVHWQESIGEKKTKAALERKQITLAEGPAACQVCGHRLREGAEVTAYAFRAAGNPVFEIGYVMCGADEHAHPTEFMRGVHELVVTGRIGRCSDVATQSSWSVLIDPEPVVESRSRSRDAHVIDETTPRETKSPTNGPPTLLAAACDDRRTDGGDN